MTTYPSEGAVAEALGKFEVDLGRHLQSVSLSDGGDSRIDGAISWLLENRSPEGYWGHRSPAVTSACLLAIARWRPGLPSNQLRDTGQWLRDQSSDWMWETVWDTGMSLSALYASDLLSAADADAAVRRLERVDLRTKLLPAHHAAQVLSFLTSSGADIEERQRWAKATRASLNASKDGAGPYVVGQVIQALLASGETAESLETELEGLLLHVKTTLLSTSSFLDYAAALRGLTACNKLTDEADSAVDAMFNSAHRQDGSWYHEPWYTAWALLALHEVRHVDRYVVEQPRMNEYLGSLKELPSELAKAEEKARHLEVRKRWQVAVLVILLEAALIGLLSSIFFLSESNRWVTSGVLVTSLSAGFAVAWRGLWPLLKPPPRTD